MNYKITVFNKYIFREMPLPPGLKSLKIGTGPGCEMRLRSDVFPRDIELALTNSNGMWQIECPEGMYLDSGDVRKLLRCVPEEERTISLVDGETGSVLLNIGFYADFDNAGGYGRCIHISDEDCITIGTFGKCRIYLAGASAGRTRAVLNRQQEGLALNIIGESTGFYKNGKSVTDGEIIRNTDFFSIKDSFFYFDGSCLWTSSGNEILVTGLRYEDIPDRHSYPLFNKKTRMKAVFDEEQIEILDPPAMPSEPSENLMSRMIPVLGMLAAASVMAARGSGAMLVFSGVSAATALVSTLYGMISAKKRYRQEIEKRKVSYERYISEKRKEIQGFRNKEAETAGYLYRPAAELIRQLKSFSPDLFDREEKDEDFLCLSLGRGRTCARKKVVYKKKEHIETRDELWLLPQLLADEYRYITDSTVICDLKVTCVLGICGPEEERFMLMKQMVLDLALRHSWEDVKMVFAAQEPHAHRICWLRMLPHVFLDENNIRGIVADEESRDNIFEYLYEELSARLTSFRQTPHIVVFFYDDCAFRNHLLSSFQESAKDIGVHFIFMAENAGNLPAGCGRIIDISEPSKAKTVSSADISEEEIFEYQQISDSDAREAVQIMAPLYMEKASAGNTLPGNISLFSMLGIFSPRDLDVGSRWSSSEIHESLKAPIGICESGIFCLDIHDRAMGPHGLIAGTTGSGKSELLQSYILSMAVNYHPHDVQFLIIDFKGGGMAASLKELPHMAGIITNIDGKEIKRSLKAIRAELMKRQRLFDEAGVNHIDRYIKKIREEGQGTKLSHLVIIVDEFAELKAQQPDFMKELISAARIGRSLGVHLILATQKPSGQVDEQIWSNSRFRICLKVQNAADSNEILKSSLAARIREPGRAYVQVGNNEIFELVQSAYSSGPVYDERFGAAFKISRLSVSGKRTVVFEGRTGGSSEDAEDDKSTQTSQVQALVHCITRYCEDENICSLPDIIKPALKSRIDFPEDALNPGKGSLMARIGVLDDPDSQYQGEYRVDLSRQNMLITGSAGTGKTNILKNIIRSIASEYSSDDVSIYIIDCASGELREFEGLNHVGGAAAAGEDEKIKQLFRLLESKLKKGGEKHVLLIIDNLTALREYGHGDDEGLLNILRNGSAGKISCVVTNQRITGTGYRFLAEFSVRLALNMNDDGEYSYLFGRSTVKPDDIPGRCVTGIDKNQFECQAYKAFDEILGSESEAVRTFIRAVNLKNPACAEKIPCVPRNIGPEDIRQWADPEIIGRSGIFAGIDYETVEPVVISLRQTPVLAVSGEGETGKYNWIRAVLCSLENTVSGKLKIFAVDGIERSLSWIKGIEGVRGYGIMPEAAVGYVLEIRDILKERYERASKGETDFPESEPLVMLILDEPEAAAQICRDPEALDAYRQITGQYRRMNICVLFTNMENSGAYNLPEITRNIRNDRMCFYFGDIRDFRLFDIPASAVKSFGGPCGRGDAFYIRNNDVRKIKVMMHSLENV